MRISVYREFLELANNLNFTRTAKQLFISQSVLSKHVVQLEEELGVSLIVRSQHHVELTEAGEVLKNRMRGILDSYDAAIEEVRLCARGIEAIRLGYLYEASQGFLHAAYRDFAMNHPSSQVQFTTMEEWQVMRGLERNELDLAITHLCNSDLGGNIRTALLYKEPFSILVHRQHPLASREAVSMDDIRPYDVYSMDFRLAPQFGSYITAVFAKHGIDSPLPLRISGTSSFGLAFSGMVDAVALVPLHFRLMFENDSEMTIIPFDKEYFSTDVVLAWNPKSETSSLMDFIQCIQGASREWKDGLAS